MSVKLLAPPPERKAHPMNVTQLLAWVICLALAFFAGLLAAHNTAKTAMLEKQFAVVQAAATNQTAALHEITSALRQIEGDLRSGAVQPAAGQTSGKAESPRPTPEAGEAGGTAPQPVAPTEAK